jgi:hypothetical protein
MEFDGLPCGFLSVKRGLGRPQTGSALHHLVTAVSVKKAFTGSRNDAGIFREDNPLETAPIGRESNW